MKGFVQLSVAALATGITATAININRRDSPLSVVLTASGNTQVQVAVTNNGNKALNLLSKGTFLDEVNPVEKVTMYSAGTKVPFEGIKIQISANNLFADAFLPLGVGETKEVTVETAAVYTLSDGGDFEVFAQGVIPYAEAFSTQLAGSIPYESNKLSMAVDGTLAAMVTKSLKKGTVIGSSCTGSKLQAIRTALSNCQRLASNAASAATAGTKLDIYFKSTATNVRNTVSARLRAIASDCGGSGSATSTNCNDPYGGCSPGVLAYTVPSQNFITYCNLFFNELPDLTSTCHGQDKANTVLHEEAHAPAVYSPGTDDLGYGYAAATRLSTSQALNNADSFSLYANAIQLNC